MQPMCMVCTFVHTYLSQDIHINIHIIYIYIYMFSCIHTHIAHKICEIYMFIHIYYTQDMCVISQTHAGVVYHIAHKKCEVCVVLREQTPRRRGKARLAVGVVVDGAIPAGHAVAEGVAVLVGGPRIGGVDGLLVQGQALLNEVVGGRTALARM